MAIGHFLARAGRRFVILEAGDSVATAWRDRWDSLVLFTPRRYDALPGLPFPGDPTATRSVTRWSPTSSSTRGRSTCLSGSAARCGRWRPRTTASSSGSRTAGASRPTRSLSPPGRSTSRACRRWPTNWTRRLFQAHSAAYRSPSRVPDGTVLVVGGGNTGFQIAKELSATHTVHLAVGSRQTPLPQRLLGRDVFWWLTRLGLLDKSVDSRLGRRARGRDTLIGSSPRELKRRFGRPQAAGGRRIRADGALRRRHALEVDAVIWATGYRPDHSWIELDIADGNGRLRHRRGVSDIPGLYFLGLSWQHTRGSALLGFVKDDAEFIAERIEAAAASMAPSADHAPQSEGASMPQAGAAIEGIRTVHRTATPASPTSGFRPTPPTSSSRASRRPSRSPTVAPSICA